MIKIGEMQVNRNINPKTFLFLIIILSCTFLAISTYLVIQFKNIKEYKKLEATIIDVYTERSRGTRDSTSQTYNYVKFSYVFNNQEYENSQLLSIGSYFVNIGELMNIYVNPNNPHEVLDMFTIKLAIFMDIFVLVFLIFLIKAYKIRVKMQYVKIDDKNKLKRI